MSHKLSKFFIFSILVFPFSSKAIDVQCHIEKYKSYTSSQEKWQRSLTDLIIKTDESFKESANNQLKVQLNYIEMSSIALKFMLTNQPKNVRIKLPINQWLSIGSNEEVELAKYSHRYYELLTSNRAERRRPAHPDMDSLRSLMRDRIQKMLEYKKLLDEFNISVSEINKISCSI